MGRDLIRAPSGPADGRTAIPLRSRRTCRSTSPRAPHRILLLVFVPSARTPERCRCNAGLAIGCCNDDMVGRSPGGLTRRAMELRPPNREHRVLEALHRAAVFCDQRIGWNRIGVALSLTIIAVAAVVLYRILRTIDGNEVVEALVTVDLRAVMLAALFVAGGYFTLTFYDLFALRTIGRTDVPYWGAALAGFTSYSVGHNVGASVITGGAVRYR